MKIIVRSFVVALALTGAIASSYAKPTVKVAKTSAMPAPLCPPSDPNACGFGTW